MTKKLQVVELSTGNVVKEVDVSKLPEHQVDKAEMGLLRNMNLDEYSVRRAEEAVEDKQDG
jgi:hypothetical protein